MNANPNEKNKEQKTKSISDFELDQMIKSGVSLTQEMKELLTPKQMINLSQRNWKTRGKS